MQFIVVQHGMAVMSKYQLFSNMCQPLKQILCSQLASSTLKIVVNQILTCQYSFSLGYLGLLSYYKTCMFLVTNVTLNCHVRHRSSWLFQKKSESIKLLHDMKLDLLIYILIVTSLHKNSSIVFLHQSHSIFIYALF